MNDMKKQYTTPEAHVYEVAPCDIIATSEQQRQIDALQLDDMSYEEETMD